MHQKVMDWADELAVKMLQARRKVINTFPPVKAAVEALPPEEAARLTGQLHAAFRDTLQEDVIGHSVDYARLERKAQDAEALCFAMLLLGDEPPTAERWKMLRGKASTMTDW